MNKPKCPQSSLASIQRKVNESTHLQTRKTPVAPPVYRPQPAPKVLQPKAASVPKPTTTVTPRTVVAPPVYRPRPTPTVLQKKANTFRAPEAKPTVRKPVAPPVYRPQPAPKVLQTKTAAKQQVPTAKADRSLTACQPQLPPKVLHVKRSDSAGEIQRRDNNPPVMPGKGARGPRQHVPYNAARPGGRLPSALRGKVAQAKAVKRPSTPARGVVQRMLKAPMQATHYVGNGVTYDQLWLKHSEGAQCQHVIHWQLPPSLSGSSGFIVQQVTLVYNGNVIDSYFEGWEVVRGVVEGGAEGGTDQFTFGPFADNSSGSIIASAEFIESDEPRTWSMTAVPQANGLRASREAPAVWRGDGLKRTFVWKTGDQGTYSLSLNGKVLANTIPLPDYYGGGVGAPDWKNLVAATRIWFEKFSTGQSADAKKQRLRALLQDSVNAGFGTLAPVIDGIVEAGDKTVIEFLNEILTTFD